MRTILKQLGKYKRDSILTLCYAGLEAVMEVILPFTTALIIDKGPEIWGPYSAMDYS